MRKGTIGVYINFLTPNREKLIRQTAQKYGYETRFITHGSIKPSDIADCEILFGQIPPEMLKCAQNLKWLQCAFAGVDKYLQDSIYPNNEVVLTNASGAYGITISEHIICVLLMLMRHMPEYTDMTRNRIWQKLPHINSIYKSKIALIGLGDIGTNFGTRAKAMGASLVGVRKNAHIKVDFCDEVYPIDKLTDAISDCDAVVASLPATEETDNLFDKNFFSHMKKGAYFINVGRGQSVDEQALADALYSNHLAGAALDVFRNEPLPSNHFLYDVPNLIITPHCSGDTALEHTCDIVIDIFFKNLQCYAENEDMPTYIDRKKGY